MPQKAKFDKDEIVDASIRLIEERGTDALTARALGEKLGCSARPIFTVFDTMDEVYGEVTRAAKAIYKGYVEAGLKEKLAFKGVGMAYIRFASERPTLFRLLFMTERQSIPDTDSVLGVIEENYDRIVDSITDNYPVDAETAKRIYRHLWIYSHGIAVLTVTKVCAFDEAEISAMLTEVFVGLLKNNIGGEV